MSSFELGCLPLSFIDGDRSEKYPKRSEFVSFGVPFLNAESISSGRLNIEKVNYITAEKFAEIKKGRVASGDIVLTMRGNGVGQVARIGNHISEALINAQMLIIRPLEGIDGSYLFHLMRGAYFQKVFSGYVSGAAQPQMTIRDLKKIPINLVRYEEQKLIGNILNNFDDLIEINDRKVKALNQSAELVYKEWFLDFKFPGHEKTKMIDSDFPDIGSIPEGWEIYSISNVATFVRGRSYTSAQLTENSGEDFVNLKCFVRDGGFRRSGIKKYTGPTKQDQILKPRDIVVAVTDMTQDRAIVARAARVPLNLSSGATFSMDLIKIQAKPNMDESWIYAYLRLSGMADHVKQFANGANVLHLNPQLIMDYPIIFPSNEIRSKFSSQYTYILDLIDNLETQNEVLAKIRDLLLPKLISGEIDISKFSNTDIENLITKKVGLTENEGVPL